MSYSVHIISLGEGTSETFRKTLRSSQFRVDHVFVLVNKDFYTRRKENDKIKRIIKAMKEIKQRCMGDKIPFEEKKISSTDIDTILNAVIEIRNLIMTMVEKDQEVRFYSSVTGGTKIDSIGLFIASIWIEATPYYFYPDKDEPIILRVPKFHPIDISKNPNYHEILRILDNEKKGCTNKRIKQIMEQEGRFHIVRKQLSSGKLTPGNLSKILRRLEEWGLIDIEIGKSRRENRVRITKDGVLTLKMIDWD